MAANAGITEAYRTCDIDHLCTHRQLCRPRRATTALGALYLVRPEPRRLRQQIPQAVLRIAQAPITRGANPIPPANSPLPKQIFTDMGFAVTDRNGALTEGVPQPCPYRLPGLSIAI